MGRADRSQRALQMNGVQAQPRDYAIEDALLPGVEKKEWLEKDSTERRSFSDPPERHAPAASFSMANSRRSPHRPVSDLTRRLDTLAHFRRTRTWRR